MQRFLLVSFAAASITLALACSDDDDSSNNNAGSSSFKSCGSGSTGTCTEADLKPYNDCVLDKCKPLYNECYGPGFQQGSFSGPCGALITCTQKCACGDLACFQACVTSNPSDACQACTEKYATCSDSCTEPACATQQQPGNGTGTCADLGACCEQLPSEQRDGCNQLKEQGNDTNCGSVLGAFKAAGTCR